MATWQGAGSGRAPAAAERFRIDGWLVLAVGASLSGALMAWSGDDVGVKVQAMALFWLFSAASVRFDVAHPYIWFGATFLTYSIAGPLLFDLGIHPLTMSGGMLVEELDFAFAMDLQYLGLVAAALMIGPRRMSFAAALDDERRHRLAAGLMPVLLVSAAISAFGATEVVAQGFTQKIDAVRFGSWTTRLGFGLNVLATCAGVYLVTRFRAGRTLNAWIAVAAFIAVGVLVILVVGQRNFLFRFLIVAFFAVHIAYRRLSIGAFLLCGIAASPLILLFGGLKMAAVAPGLDIGDAVSVLDPGVAISELPPEILWNMTLTMLLGDEFMSAGNNLAMLVTRMPQELPFQYGASLVQDVLRAFQPGFIIGQDWVHSASIYNATLFPLNTARGGGQGFTFIGTGYLNFGTAGAVAIMAALGLAIRAVYRWAGRSAFGLFVLLGFMPVVVYTARSDLSVPLSQMLKHVILPLAAMLAIAYLTARSAPARPRAGPVSQSQ